MQDIVEGNLQMLTELSLLSTILTCYIDYSYYCEGMDSDTTASASDSEFSVILYYCGILQKT